METQSPVERTLTQTDYVRLTRLASLSGRDAYGAIHELLEISDLVASAAVPATVVTMYTQVLLRGDTGTAPYKVTLCYPDGAEPSQGFISVLSPLGASLVGLRVGDAARWRTPLGEERMARIVDVLFQPEASGDYTL
ncbi:MAG TPA: GreA/GreB family elongation factor [Ramlibacter sp.]|nr:GreA/GreB family elongation factor [Ramlibacter sp.]